MVNVGDVVVSIAGKDIGNFYLVKDVTKNCVLLVDGKKRTYDNPKTKNLKHIRKICEENFNFFCEFNLKNFAINARIYKILKNLYSNQGV